MRNAAWTPPPRIWAWRRVGAWRRRSSDAMESAPRPRTPQQLAVEVNHLWPAMRPVRGAKKYQPRPAIALEVLSRLAAWLINTCRAGACAAVLAVSDRAPVTMRLLHVLLCCAERTCRRGGVMQAGSLRPQLKIKRVVDHLSEVRLLGAVSALMARGMDWRRFRSDGFGPAQPGRRSVGLGVRLNITAVMWPIGDMVYGALAPQRWRSVPDRARCRHPRCPTTRSAARGRASSRSLVADPSRALR
jgi:hypothetical protein